MILTVHSCFIVCEKLFFLSWLNPRSNLKAAGLIINVAYSHGGLDSVPSTISCFFFDINYSADVVVTWYDMLWPLVTWDGVKSKISPEWCCHCRVDPTVPLPLIIAVSEAGCRFRLLSFLPRRSVLTAALPLSICCALAVHFVLQRGSSDVIIWK